MGLNAGVITGQAVQGHAGVTLLARVLGNGALPITRASMSSIAYALFDLIAGVQLSTGTVSLTSVSDSLVQNDLRWTKDSQLAPGPDALWGYNFLFVLGASLFPAETILPAQDGAPRPKANRLQCEVAFTPASGEIFRATYRWTPTEAFS